jgi:hypothetical protein
MDQTTRDLERKMAADPADGAAAARLARSLFRAGRIDEARATVRARIAAGEIDADTLSLALELGEGSIKGTLPRLPRANVSCVVKAGRSQEGLVELAPVVAFAGVAGAGARESILALGELLGENVQETRVLRVDDERVLDLRVKLARPWIVSRAYAVRSIRIVTVPVAPHAVKLRRQLLKTTSALAFVVDGRSNGEDERFSNEAAWKALAADFNRAHGFGLAELPLAFLYPDAVEDASHRWLTVALGLRGVARVDAAIKTTAPEAETGAPRFARAQDDDRIVAHEGVVEIFSLLLAGIASAVKGIAAPRPRFTRGA